MSHFITLVLLTPAEMRGGEKQIQDILEYRLAPYDENHPVPPYEEFCYCVGRKAKSRVEEQLNREMGTWGDARERFDTDQPKNKSQAGQDLDWTNNIYKPRLKQEKELFEQQPDRETPDPECEECGGTGKVLTQYSPHSKWDWWKIGGRWDGFFGGKEEMNKRSSNNGFNFGNEHSDLSFNSAPVKSLLDENGHLDEKLTGPPFAIIDSKGRWAEKGDMGWWGMVADEKEEDEWKTQVETILNENLDCTAIVCDLHI